jgi:uncharacterized protein (DUF2267 family)
MSANKLPVFDTTIQVTNEWINDICAEIDTLDAHRAFAALRSVLHALRDRLPIAVAVHFAAQLPVLLRGVYYEGWDPASVPMKLHRDQFLNRIGHECQEPRRPHMEELVQAVFRVVRDHVSEGEVDKVLSVLPKDLQELLVAAPSPV